MPETPLGHSNYLLAFHERSWLIIEQLSMRVLARLAALDPGRTAVLPGPSSRGAFS